MRFISMVKFAEAKAVPPSKAFLEAMGQLTQDAAKAGCVMIGAEGLLRTTVGARVRLPIGKVTVMDGPFAEAKEVVGGYAIFEVNSKAEMLEWTRRFMDLHRTLIPGWEGEAEAPPDRGAGRKAMRPSPRDAGGRDLTRLAVAKEGALVGSRDGYRHTPRNRRSLEDRAG